MTMSLMLRDTPFDPQAPGAAGTIFGSYDELRIEADAVYAPAGPDFALAFLEGGGWTGDVVGRERSFAVLVVLSESPTKPLDFVGAGAPNDAAYLNLPVQGHFVGTVRVRR